MRHNNKNNNDNQNNKSGSYEPQWPVELYRYTDCEGWQKQQTQGITLEASPRKDSIVLPSLRQKFTLKGEKDHDKSSVIRRNNCILLISRKRTRAMMLQFATLQDCLDFSDRFCEINHPSIAENNNADPDAAASKRIQLNHSQNTDVYNHENGNGNANGLEASSPVRIQEQEQVLSHIVQLLHSSEFMGLVHKLEQCIKNSDDGAQLLQALEYRDQNVLGQTENDTADVGGGTLV